MASARAAGAEFADLFDRAQHHYLTAEAEALRRRPA